MFIVLEKVYKGILNNENNLKLVSSSNKQQLSSLTRQAKTREQGFKIIHSTKRIKK